MVYKAPDPAAISQIPEALLAYREELKVVIPEPALPCVYFLIFDREIVYVGQTISLPKRLQEHRALGKVFDRALYLLVPENELLGRESQFIKALRPRLNERSGPSPASPPQDRQGTQLLENPTSPLTA